MSREQAVDEGWFGPVSDHVADRIGQHGSLTSAEQLVPLLVARDVR